MKFRLPQLSRQSTIRLIAIVAFAVVMWVGFFDSHSVYKRIRWSREASQLETENAALQAEIQRLEDQLGRRLTDEEIERIAREEYGMRRQGETVYPEIKQP